MSLLQTYIDGICEGDADKVASVFAENALFNDAAPEAMGMDPLVFNSREGIKENFAGLLANGGLNVQDVCIVGHSVRYDIVLAPEMVVKALGVATIENGQIVEYQVGAPT